MYVKTQNNRRPAVSRVKARLGSGRFVGENYPELSEEGEITTYQALSELANSSTASRKRVASLPTQDSLYRIKSGDTLLEIAGTAYGKKAGTARLQRAQLINRHPFNWRYYTPAKQSFTKKHFPEGFVSFSPGVSCNDADFNLPWEFPPEGRCYPLLFIPPETDVWVVPPAEVVQSDLRTCWAAAILSWSRVTPGAKRFTSLNDVINAFRKLELHIPTSGGVKKRPIVNKSGGLIRWPKEEDVFIGTKAIKVPAGQMTREMIATELRLNVVVKDNTLSLADVDAILKSSQGPVIVLKSSAGKVGHATVIFGVSTSDGFIGEMDPFDIKRPGTGPAFGALKTRWLPTFNAFKVDSNKSPWQEFAFFFKRKVS